MPTSTALVLGGGGARAAYQVGVLKALVQLYPRNHGIPFKIICGTSAGAINGTSIATHASCFHLGVKKLEWVWRHFETRKVYRATLPGVLKHLSKMALKGLQDDKVNTDAGSLLDNEPLRHLLNELIDFKRIDRNIRNGALTALSVDTSCYNNSRSVTFFQAARDIENWTRARRSGERRLLNTEHLLASSAIPMVFPSIKLNQAYYGDGSVHQLAPLSSPIHLGANKLLVINLDSPHKHFPMELEYHPKTATIAGHLLDTIFSDTLNSDLERLERINHTLSLIPEESRAQLALHPIKTLVIKPSEDLSKIAARFYDDMPWAIKTLLGFFGIDRQSDSSIVSYLLFEKSYTSALIDLGYQDGMAHLDELKAFFNLAECDDSQ
ncbi:patatin-like phospholipase family protein [Shewanella xiamenensis]|uniref:patatin-like phospholipase family protein n=1 Tax=Shewanella xiamenensis TaxID=332186 RepID=UPI0024A64A7C|nr:patatin-like phospholipase family protein [Shewanella xiamenensis]MDI5836528.1 patatin-like phospholipase family protein [Shewanella xiamenensis]MDI5840741.1 patatin-like phospholipase family protein [Shewanella xiamenensis]MDI5844768.1 patatin-like phospholipase family protein [Shewanella xiamenensis]MDI5852587.1 patatin-like phospholipase family protein [Shewanella xiamenensis]MDI5856702.1 patatin-like phospholipase family protein [Shewanella xiamenensis]